MLSGYAGNRDFLLVLSCLGRIAEGARLGRKVSIDEIDGFHGFAPLWLQFMNFHNAGLAGSQQFLVVSAHAPGNGVWVRVFFGNAGTQYVNARVTRADCFRAMQM